MQQIAESSNEPADVRQPKFGKVAQMGAWRTMRWHFWLLGPGLDTLIFVFSSSKHINMGY